MSKKIAIVGFAGTKDLAPYADPSWEIWSVNNLYKFIPRTDRIFQLHTRESLQQDHHGMPGQEHLEYLQQATIPIIMQEHYEDIPASVAYPLEEMIEAYGIPRIGQEHRKDAYFTNSVSFMLALAIYEGADVIGIYGVDMAVLSEYNEQRPSCEYYIGVAKGRGIEILLPTEADLLKTRWIYGYEDEKKTAWELKLNKTIEEMQERRHQSDTVIRNQQSVSDKYEGAITALLEMHKTWG